LFSQHQVRAKTRFAIKRREEEVEQDEIESGEINLIPYLDIVTNLMLFLLASVSASLILGQINSMLPDQAPPTNASATPPSTNPDDQPLKMVVEVTSENLSVWSVSGREGTLKAPKVSLPRVGLDGSECDGGYMCESGTCDTSGHCGPNSDSTAPRLPVFDYRAVNQVLYDIASQHYKGKKRTAETYQAVLMADDTIPYETLISIMGAMRCKMPLLHDATERCYLPSTDPGIVDPANPAVDDVDRLYDTARADYDPDKMALFNDVLFSRGFD